MRAIFVGVCGECGKTFQKPKRGNQPYRFCSLSCASSFKNRIRYKSTDKLTEDERLRRRRQSVRKWQLKNPEQHRTHKRAWYARKRETIMSIRAERSRTPLAQPHELRRRALAMLGDRCIACGFSDWRALQIDHVNGGGRKDVQRFANQREYLKAVLAAPAGIYQLLCANCNSIKRIEKMEMRKAARAVDAVFAPLPEEVQHSLFSPPERTGV